MDYLEVLHRIIRILFKKIGILHRIFHENLFYKRLNLDLILQFEATFAPI